MYCESQPRYKGKSWLELFPEDAFPNDTPEDKVKSEAYTMCYVLVTSIMHICHS